MASVSHRKGFRFLGTLTVSADTQLFTPEAPMAGFEYCRVLANVRAITGTWTLECQFRADGLITDGHLVMVTNQLAGVTTTGWKNVTNQGIGNAVAMPMPNTIRANPTVASSITVDFYCAGADSAPGHVYYLGNFVLTNTTAVKPIPGIISGVGCSGLSLIVRVNSLGAGDTWQFDCRYETLFLVNGLSFNAPGMDTAPSNSNFASTSGAHVTPTTLNISLNVAGANPAINCDVWLVIH